MAQFVSITTSAEVVGEYDAIVCGAGPAGFCAALSAARNGAKVALVEQMGYMGGAATVNGVNVFTFGYHDGKRHILSGLFAEIYDELLRRDAIIPHWQHGWEPFNTEVYKRVLDDMLYKAGVDVYLESTLTYAKTENGTIQYIALNTIKGTVALKGRVFIDATGDGALAAMSGAPCDIGREKDGAIQPYTMMFFMGGVDIDAIKVYNRDKSWKTDDGRDFVNGNGFRDFIEKANAEGLDFIPKKTIGSLYNIPWLPGVVGVNFGRVFADRDMDARRLFDDTRMGRKQVEQAVEIMRGYIPGFKNAYLLETSPKIGRRESRRIRGKYVMTGDDVKTQRQFDDVIAQACYQIDIHGPTDATYELVKIPEGTHYDIPYRCLLPENVDNMLVAGRCVSATHEALGAIRVQPVCMAMGQAAGAAAALCVKENVSPSSLDVALLQQTLTSQGVILN